MTSYMRFAQLLLIVCTVLTLHALYRRDWLTFGVDFFAFLVLVEWNRRAIRS